MCSKEVGMGVDDDLKFIFEGNKHVQLGGILNAAAKKRIAEGKAELPRRGPVPEEVTGDENITTPLLTPLRQAQAYTLLLNIPSRFRKKLGWKKGDVVQVELVGNILTVTKVE